MEVDAKELEHSSLQEKLDKELAELDKKLEQKEVKVALSSFKLVKMLAVFYWVLICNKFWKFTRFMYCIRLNYMFCKDMIWFYNMFLLSNSFFLWLKAEMKLYNNGDPSILRHHFEKKLLEMEQEKKTLQVMLCAMISMFTCAWKVLEITLPSHILLFAERNWRT